MPGKILLAGESWTSYTTHVKGFDAFIKRYTACLPIERAAVDTLN